MACVASGGGEEKIHGIFIHGSPRPFAKFGLVFATPSSLEHDHEDLPSNPRPLPSVVLESELRCFGGVANCCYPDSFGSAPRTAVIGVGMASCAPGEEVSKQREDGSNTNVFRIASFS